MRVLLVLAITLPQSLLFSVKTASADAAWTAYNDCQYRSGERSTNITQFRCHQRSDTTNSLIKYSDGTATGVTVDITISGEIQQQVDNYYGSLPTGGDAATVFNPFVSMTGGESLRGTSSSVTLTFNGLSPAKTYTFATSANRAGGTSYANRLTKFVLSGVDSAASFVNTSSTGTTIGATTYSGDSTTFSTGENTTNGYIARWENIQPGSDGRIVITSSYASSGTNNYPSGPAVFLIAEEASTGPTITTTGALTAFSSQPGVYSDAQSYTVAGANLTEDIVVTAPTGFEISTDGSTFSSSLTIPQSDGVVSDTTLFVHMISTEEGTPGGVITHTSADANQVDVAVSGTVRYVYSLTVNSAGGTVTLSPDGGSYDNGTVVTLTPVPNTGYAFSSWSGDLTGSDNPATITMDGNKTVTANFTISQCTTVNLDATEDNWLRGSQATTNYGGDTTLSMNPNGSNSQFALLKWDLSSIPSGATIENASLTFYVTEPSVKQFYLYNMRKSWVEGSGTTDETPSSTSSNWNTSNGVTAWSTAGAQNTTSDRYNTNLWNAVTSTFDGAANRSVTVALNESGIAVVQGWRATPSANYGLTIQNNATDSDRDYLIIASSEAADAAQHPKLNVAYCSSSTGPTIATSGTLSAFSSQPGVASDAQSYIVAGSNLTNDITIAAPTGYEISTDGTTYGPSLTLPQSSGFVAAKTVYVRQYSETEGSLSGVITHTSDDAGQVDVAVSGEVFSIYTLTATSSGNGSVTLNPTGGSYNSGTTVTLTPAPDSGYTFSNWGGANSGELTDNGDGTWSIAMNGNKTVIANFAQTMSGTVTFQNGVSSYTGTLDTFLRGSTAGGTNHSSETVLEWDDNSQATSDEIALIRFTELFGAEGGPIPAGATVTSATLTYITTNLSGTSSADGDAANVYESLVDWPVSTVAYNNFGGDAGVSSDEYKATPVVVASADDLSTAYSIDVTASLQTWSASPSANYGWVFYPTADDGVTIHSSEATTVANRPLLTVTYTLPSTNPTIYTNSSLSAFSSTVNVASAEQSYTVSASNLSSNISITAPSGFEISTASGSGFGSTLTLPQTSGSVPSTPIYVRFLRSTAGTSTGNITHTSTGAAQVNVAVSGTATNGAPVVTLAQPADSATGISTPPTLSVTVTDPEAEASNVSFYGRPVGSGSGEDFMLVLIPDPQNESQSAPAMFTAQTNWIAENKEANNIVYVTATGDMVNMSSSATQYGNADAAIDRLDAGGVWYTMATGNHDIASGSTLYANYFGPSRYANYEVADGFWFGGSYNDYNTYSLFSAGGMDFILINLQYSPTTAILNWADALLTTHSDRRAIVEQHDILNVNNSWNNPASYDALRDHDNLFLMLCGHMHSGSDGAAYVAGTGTGGAGQTIHVVQADYQELNSGNGYLRLFRFSPANDTIYMTTYSPYSGESLTSTVNYDQADLAYNMDGASEPFTLIGTVNDVTSGSNASISWPGLATNAEYEWYAVASDGSSTVTSDTWSFTTSAAQNNVPQITQGSSISVNMSEDSSPTAFSLTLNATDADNDPLTWSISTIAAHGAASASGTGTSKAIGYIPNENFSGNDSFVVQVSDGNGGSAVITVNVTVQGENDIPVITGQTVLTTIEETPLEITLANLTVTDQDNTYPTGFSLTVLGGLNYTVNGTIITPAADFNGALSVPVIVNDGLANSNSYNLSVTVTGVNDAPVITQGSAVSVGMSVDGSPTAFSLTLNATDVDSAGLNWGIITAPLNGIASASETGASIAVGYTPYAGYIGTDSFIIQVSDGSNGVDTITVNVTVAAAARTISGNAGVAGATITYTGGTVTAGANGNFSFTVAYNWSGTVTPSLDSYTFAPESLTFNNVTTNQTGADFTATAVFDQGIALQAGWNLVSLSILPYSTAIDDVLASVSGNYDLVYAWDATGEHSTSSGNWLKYDNVEASTDTLTVLDERMGFWIHMTAADTLIVTGEAPTTTIISLYDNTDGWNLVAYPSSVNGQLPVVLSGTDFSLVYAYQAADTADHWKLYDSASPDYANDLTSLSNGWGYWIKVSADGNWIVTYAEP